MKIAAWVVLALGMVGCDRAGEEAPVLKPKNPERARTDAAREARAAEAMPRAAEAKSATCPAVVVAIKKSGVWIRDPNMQGVIAPCAGGELDRAAVQLRLCSTASGLPPSCTAIEVAAEPGVPYREIIDVMDVAIAAGFPDVGLTDPSGLSLQFRDPPDPGDAVSALCGAPAPVCPPRPAATGTQPPAASPTAPPVLPLPADRSAIEGAVVIAVPADGSVLVGGKQVATPREAKAGERIEPLYRALSAAAPAGAARTAVLQVDRTVDARVVNRVITTAQAAGYQQLMFAVSSK